jgi:hypothetical protein
MGGVDPHPAAVVINSGNLPVEEAPLSLNLPGRGLREFCDLLHFEEATFTGKS